MDTLMSRLRDAFMPHHQQHKELDSLVTETNESIARAKASREGLLSDIDHGDMSALLQEPPFANLDPRRSRDAASG